MAQWVQAGHPLGAYRGRRILSYDDPDHDGVIGTPSCRAQGGQVDAEAECGLVLGPNEYLGSPYPTRTLSIASRLTVHHTVTFSALLDYRGGQMLYNEAHHYRCTVFFNCAESQEPTPPLAEQAKLVASTFGAFAPYIEDASYWKLRELSISFAAPASWAARLGASRVAYTVAGRNLATWTHYSGFDPEVNVYGTDPVLRADYVTQPSVRYILTRVDIGW